MRKVVLGFAFLAIALFFSANIHAQARSVRLKSTAAVNSRNSAVMNELDRQRLFLQKVTSRYEAVSVNEFTPYLSYGYIWKALKENRQQLTREMKKLTPAQAGAVKKGYEMLEEDVLRQFVDQQFNVLISELGLNEVQVNEIEKLLANDLKLKRSLLSASGHTPETFGERIEAISSATEKRILSILFPEQKETFRREVNLNRNRLVG